MYITRHNGNTDSSVSSEVPPMKQSTARYNCCCIVGGRVGAVPNERLAFKGWQRQLGSTACYQAAKRMMAMCSDS